MSEALALTAPVAEIESAAMPRRTGEEGSLRKRGPRDPACLTALRRPGAGVAGSTEEVAEEPVVAVCEPRREALWLPM
jgi:hypothetical protein